jgi:hypothetical protein
MNTYATRAWQAMKWTLLVLSLVACFTALGVAPAPAQDPGVLIQGRVLWVAAEKMVIAPYVFVSGNASSINVDLSQAHQDEYDGLKTGDSVAVMGTVAPEGDRVIATSIRLLSPS